jgi:hypothetical protein
MSIKQKKKNNKKKDLKTKPIKRKAKILEYWVPVYSNGAIVAYAAVPLGKK